MKPELNEGLYVFCTVPPHHLPDIPIEDIFMHFREKEGITIVISEALAVQHLLKFEQRLFLDYPVSTFLSFCNRLNSGLFSNIIQQ
jgi:hypothetical protein